jgi:AhpD family alkylhydroperoxidase
MRRHPQHVGAPAVRPPATARGVGSPRVPPAAELPPELAGTIVQPAPGVAWPPNAVATVARRPELATPYFDAIHTVLAGGLPRVDQEVVILRIMARARCVYAFSRHVPLGRAAGLSEQQIAALAGDGGHEWEPREQALVAFADAIHDAADLGDATWWALRAHYSEEEAIELLLLAGLYRLTAGVLNAARVELDAGIPAYPL